MTIALNVLGDLSGGQTMIDFATAIKTAVEKTKETGKPASVSLSLTFKPSGEVIKVADKITSKLPSRERLDTLFFTTKDGALTREDPRQIAMFGDKSSQTITEAEEVKE